MASPIGLSTFGKKQVPRSTVEKRSQGCGMFSSTHTLNLERVWKIVKEDLPKLESEVLKLRKQLT